MRNERGRETKEDGPLKGRREIEIRIDKRNRREKQERMRRMKEGKERYRVKD